MKPGAQYPDPTAHPVKLDRLRFVTSEVFSCGLYVATAHMGKDQYDVAEYASLGRRKARKLMMAEAVAHFMG